MKVVVPHGLGLPEPGLRGFRGDWAVGGALSPVECCVEGFPRGAFAACEGGGLEESLLAPWGVFRVNLRGIGLGCHEDSVCPVEGGPLGVRFEDVDCGLFWGACPGCPTMGWLVLSWRGGGVGWPCGLGVDPCGRG